MSFDPYRKWLGIPDNRRPPSYYELLGITPGENDSDVIRSAIDQRRMYILSKKGEGQDGHVKIILRLIEEATSTLLVPEFKHGYDRQLGLHLKKKGSRRSYVLPSWMESQVVRIYGEGSGIVGDLFGIVAILLGAFGLMAWWSFTLQKKQLTGNESNEMTWMEKATLADGVKQNDIQVKPNDELSSPAKPIEEKATLIDQNSSTDLASTAIPLLGTNNLDPSSIDGNSPDGILKQLQGKWQSVAQERNGAVMTPANVAKENKVMTIKGDNFRVSYNQHWLPNPAAQGVEQGRIISFNLTSTPQQIEILLPEPLYLKGIFELRGDRLRHCFRRCPLKDSNCSSPTEFTTYAGEAVFFTEYVKVVEDTTEPSTSAGTAKTQSKTSILDDAKGKVESAWSFFDIFNKGVKPDQAFIVSQDGRLVCLGKMGGYCLASLKPLSEYKFKIEFLIPPQGLKSGPYIAVASSKPNPKGKDFTTQYPFGIEIKLDPDVIGELVLPKPDFKVELPLGQLRDQRKIVAIRKPSLKPGDWNALEVTCDEHKNVTVKINGTTVNAIAKAERTEGHIVIMPLISEIQFRSPILVIDDVEKLLPFTSIITK